MWKKILLWSKSYFHGAPIIVSLLSCLPPEPWAFTFLFPILLLLHFSHHFQTRLSPILILKPDSYLSLLQTVFYISYCCVVSSLFLHLYSIIVSCHLYTCMHIYICCIYAHMQTYIYIYTYIRTYIHITQK